jgi:hypothetical protein
MVLKLAALVGDTHCMSYLRSILRRTGRHDGMQRALDLDAAIAALQASDETMRGDALDIRARSVGDDVQRTEWTPEQISPNLKIGK